MADDPEGFAAVQALEAEFHEIIAEQARRLNSERRPYSWAELARPLGISPQAAHKRYGKPDAV